MANCYATWPRVARDEYYLLSQCGQGSVLGAYLRICFEVTAQPCTTAIDLGHSTFRAPFYGLESGEGSSSEFHHSIAIPWPPSLCGDHSNRFSRPWPSVSIHFNIAPLVDLCSNCLESQRQQIHKMNRRHCGLLASALMNTGTRNDRSLVF